MKTTMKRTEASKIVDEATQVYLTELFSAGVSLTDQQLKQVRQKIRDLSKKYVESAYELYDC